MMKDVWISYIKNKRKSFGKNYCTGSTENIIKANSEENTKEASLRHLELCRGLKRGCLRKTSN